ncbi:MAG: hypothetical protein MRERV_22c015 [Mycoplasmataceae bacterium RV_VA103A]|nr:MAG: hypothetical protein MRERV_22c015 [Mycoplasmataceae bacterium RV_VA103A]
MLKKVFISLREKKDNWLGFSEGEQLESKLATELKKIGFTHLNKKDLAKEEKTKWQELKERVKSNELIINNFPNWTKNSFVYLPYGTQNYPDFLIFTSKYIIPLEVKTSTKGGIKPMWNSHLPRANGLYVFASFGKRDITFFHGADVIDPQLSKQLIGFFEKEREIKQFEKKFIKNLPKSERGWKVYIRIVYDQVKSLLSPQGELNYFQHPRRKECEDKVLEWLEDKE